MPLLKPEVQLFPAGLFDLAEAGAPWLVAHTRSRQEKVLSRHLVGCDIPFYLPCGQRRTRRAGRTFAAHLPLFPGYVFFRGGPRERREAFRSQLIVRILDVEDQEQFARELLQIRHLQQMHADMVPYPEFEPGDPVAVTEGPFQGYTGVVVRLQGRLRLIVSISMLKRSVSVGLDRNVVASDSTPRRRPTAGPMAGCGR